MEVLAGLDLPLSFLLLPLVALLIYIYATWPYSHFQKLGISGPPPQPFFGNQKQFFAKSSVYVLKEWAEEYGPVYGIYMGRDPLFVITDLDILKSVLVKDSAHFIDRWSMHTKFQATVFQISLPNTTGADWKRARSIITPTFSASRLKMMEPLINHCSQDLTDNLLEKAQHSQQLNVKQFFGAYTLDVIASTAFGLPLTSQRDTSDPFLIHVRGLLEAVTRFKFLSVLLVLMPWLSPLVKRVMDCHWYNKPLHFYITSLETMIQQRKAMTINHSKPVDFLQLLINAEATDHDQATDLKKYLTKDEIISNMLIFFFAGYETTASTLNYLAYNLAKHPDIQQRVVTEMEQELGEETPTYDNVSKLKYMDQVIHETLRLHPPISSISRLASETVTIKGVTIPKGFGVLVPVYQIMRDPEYFPDPEHFDPDRFSDKGGMESIRFLAFGFGPRSCIGTRLALLEIKIALVHMLRKLQFVRTPDLPERIQYVTGMGSILTSASPILIKVEPRHPAPQQ